MGSQMGFYIRKSIRVGPLRFNLSKSGIGVSAGIKGLRIGTGPRGNYVHIGRNGLYYRQTLSTPSKSPRYDSHSNTETPSDTHSSHGPMKSIDSCSVSRMTDSSSAALLSEIEQKTKRIQVWPVCLSAMILLLIAFLVFEVTPWISTLFFLVMLLATFWVYQHDILKKSVVMMYELDEESTTAFKQLHNVFSSLNLYGKIWHVYAQGDVYNPKYHAGAGGLISRNCIQIPERAPPFIRTNLSILKLKLGTESLYFFPDRILIYSSKMIGALDYSELQLSCSSTRFIEDGKVPKDTKVVDFTWQYVNKSGGPDRRFNNNPKLPVCLYEEIRFRSRTGLNKLIQASRVGVGHEIEKAIAGMKSAIKEAQLAEVQREEKERIPKIDHIPQKAEPSKQTVQLKTPETEELFEILFNVLCCVMVSDGRASRSEKKRIRELMGMVKAPWTAELIENRILDFIDQVHKSGFRHIKSTTLPRVKRFKQIGKQDILLKCIDLLATADGKLDRNEQDLCNQIRDILA